MEIPELQVDPVTQLVTVNDDSPSISVLWDRAVQEAVINTRVGPTIASRAYSMVHTAIYDAWAAYDPSAISTQLGDELQRPQEENTEANKSEAMSFSAYRTLVDLFPSEQAIFDNLMTQLGLDPSNTTTDVSTPAGIGNVSAQALLEFRHNDGSNQLGDDPNGNGNTYSDIIGYQPQNLDGDAINIELWTPEHVPIDDPTARVQSFLTPQWAEIIPFSLESSAELREAGVLEDPEPFLLPGVDAEVDLDAGEITLADGSVVEISQDIIGTIINPGFIEQAEQLVNWSADLTDEQKLIAEFWEDAGGTSFPPGTWMTFGQFVSARDENTLDQDVELFFNLGNAVFDAGVATWEAKVFYDYARPVRAVRDLGEQGLIGEFDPELGGFAIDAWAGPGEGTQRILATDFLTYQTPGGDPSPPFAEYVSGHSTFSSAAAEVLQRFTGSDDFGGSVTFQPGESRFEPGVTPQQVEILEWATFSDAANEASESRFFGGIHFEDGGRNGEVLGQQVGTEVWNETQSLLNPNQIASTTIDNTLGAAQLDTNQDTGTMDILNGASQNDLINATPGENFINAEDGNDFIVARKGDDIIDAGAGRDIIAAQRGNDLIIGGPGSDLFDFGHNHGNNTIADFEDGIDFIRLRYGLEFEELVIEAVEGGTTISLNENSNGDLQIQLPGIDVANITAHDFLEILV